MSDAFVANYILSCVAKGKPTLPEICLLAKAEVGLIDEELKKLDALRTKQINLRALLRQLGQETEKKPPVSSAIINTSIPFAELPLSIQNIACKICNFVEAVKREVTNREIMEEVAEPEDHKEVLIAIKWLWDNEIIHRNEQSHQREISTGSKWNQRPQLS